MKEIRYDHADVSNRDFAMPVEVTTTGDADDAQQATGEQQRPPLSNFNARDLSALRAIILRVIDDGAGDRPWLLYPPDAGNWRMVDDADVDAERLDFCDRIQQAIVARAAPATTAGKGGEKR